MLRIPNLDRMQVNTKVHEAMVARIRGDVRVPTHIVEFVQAGMLPNTDPFGRVLATRARRHRGTLREKFRRHEYKKVADGQRAIVRVDRCPEKQFVGHVRSRRRRRQPGRLVDLRREALPDLRHHRRRTAARRQDASRSRASDIKPDMTAEVTISVDAAKEPVLTVPDPGGHRRGRDRARTREVFVKTADRLRAARGQARPLQREDGRDPHGADGGRRDRRQPEGAARRQGQDQDPRRRRLEERRRRKEHDKTGGEPARAARRAASPAATSRPRAEARRAAAEGQGGSPAAAAGRRPAGRH